MLAGLSVRTSFAKETNTLTSEIAKLVGRYFTEKYGEKIPHRKKAGVTYCVYSDYENEYRGAYTYFIGEEVETVEGMSDSFSALLIPAGDYQKFTAGPGPVPLIILNTWQKIWQLFQGNEYGKRLYKVDFEVYDERAVAPQNSIVDIYVGVTK